MKCQKSFGKIVFVSTLMALIAAASVVAPPALAQGSKPGEISDIRIQIPVSLYIHYNGTLVTLPFSVVAGDVVLLDIGGNLNDPNTWSGILRFSDDPMGPSPCSPSATHCQLFWRITGAPGFVDRYTGFRITLADICPAHNVITEDPSGVTIYLNYYIFSPEELPPVGGTLVTANRLSLLIPSIGLIFAAAAIIQLGLKRGGKQS